MTSGPIPEPSLAELGDDVPVGAPAGAPVMPRLLQLVLERT